MRNILKANKFNTNFSSLLSNFPTSAPSRRRLLLLLLAAGILISPRTVFSEGSYQFGLNQFLYDYSYKTSPKYVDIITSGEIINISLCGHINTDQLSVIIIAPDATTTTYNITSPSDPGHVDVADPFTSPLTNPIRYDTSDAGSGFGLYEIRLENISGSGFWRYDISVTPNISTDPDPTVAAGRLYAYIWAFTDNGYGLDQSTDADCYTLVPGGRANTNYVWFLDLNNLVGWAYDIIANNLGVSPPYSGYSIPIAYGSTTPKWPVYVGYPTIADPPPILPPFLSNVRFIDDEGVDITISPNGDLAQDTGYFEFTSDVTGTCAITVDINQNGQYGAGDRLLLSEVMIGANSVLWDGKDTNGVVVPVGTYATQIQVRMGEYHFIVSDVETSGGGTQDGLTIREVFYDQSLANDTLVFWDDKTILDGTTTLPDGALCNSPEARHTWGDFTGISIGNNSYMDTYVYGLDTLVSANAIVSNNNDPLLGPVLDLDADNSSGLTGADYQTSFTLNGSAVAISDSDVTITDDGATIASATITLSSPRPGDVLTVAEAALPSGITLDPASNNHYIILNGTAGLADFETAIKLVSFENTLPAPVTTNRTLTVVVNDGVTDSNLALSIISMLTLTPLPTPAITPAATAGNTATFTPNIPEKRLGQGGGYAEPNPFFPQRGQKVQFLFSLDNANSYYKIRIFTIKNRLIRTLDNLREWDGRDNRGHALESGVYIYQIESGNRHESGTVVLLMN